MVQNRLVDYCWKCCVGISPRERYQWSFQSVTLTGEEIFPEFETVGFFLQHSVMETTMQSAVEF